MTDAGLEHTDFLGRAFAEIYGKPGGLGASVGYADDHGFVVSEIGDFDQTAERKSAVGSSHGVVIKSFAAGRHLLVVIFAAVPCGEAIGPVTGVAES